LGRGLGASSGSARLSTGIAEQAFRHDALLYDGYEQFLGGTLPFIQAALDADEPILVAVDRAKIDLLASELAGAAELVRFADVREIGANPARLIPAWREFHDASAAPGRRIWGIGEPVWSDRSEAELVESQRHEALLNLAFADAAALSLLCLYDAHALGEDVIAGVHHSHPAIVQSGARRESQAYCGLAAAAAPFADPLPEPSAAVREFAFRSADLPALRRLVVDRARAAGLGSDRGDDLMLAANEVATNSVRHGGGRGVLRVWQEGDALICEVRDGGRLDDPLAGRRRPHGDQLGGRGLWLTNQVCDLVQLRSFQDGTAVRLHMRVG
jgi:anti-sigma regulatory factor (Ser/Thr protein kinase)